METQLSEFELTTRATGVAPTSHWQSRVEAGTIEASLSPRWFAAYTLAHHEKRVADLLARRCLEAFLPLYPALRRWRNRCRKRLELPVFPNYVFVRIPAGERVRVLSVPGVLSLVGFGGRPAPLPDGQIEALRALSGRRGLEPHPYLAAGERARIVAGPMSGFEGVLLRRKNNLRLVLALDVILKSVAVEVDEEDVEPVTRVWRPFGPAALAAGTARSR